jgi:tRNA(Ile2) C34 agmatinyltransferase TiaS
MRAYLGFDDTDILGAPMGTGKLVRRFEALLPAGCRLWGVVRQQLLVDPRIPYTSHNSSACAVVDCGDPSCRDELLARAVTHIEHHSCEGSDPGLCLACEGDTALKDLAALGLACTARLVSQDEARRAAAGIHLSGHGGTCDGIIGAAAAVGLTAAGWSGRFIEFNGLRDVPDRVRVRELEQRGIRVVSLDRDAVVPGGADVIDTQGWLRPRLWGGEAVLPVQMREDHWESLGGKRKKTT